MVELTNGPRLAWHPSARYQGRTDRDSGYTSSGGASSATSTSAGSGASKGPTADPYGSYGAYGSYGTGTGDSAKFWEAAGAAFGSGAPAREASPRLQAPVRLWNTYPHETTHIHPHPHPHTSGVQHLLHRVCY